MEEWKEYKLGEIAEFRTGKLNSNAAIINGKYPFFTCAPETYYINDYAFDQKAILLAGNNAEGNFNIKYYEGKFNAYQRTYVINPTTTDIDIHYLFYALQLCLKQFKTLSQGTSTKFLTAKILDAFTIQVPSIQIQKRISNIIKSLDDKIENNRKINENLEQQAQALFKSWFVDFEPFRDQPFVESELGMIPEGWRVVSLNEACIKITDGSHYSPQNNPDGNIPMLSVKDMGHNGFDYSNCKMINEQEFEIMKNNDCVPLKDDILVAKDGSYLKELFQCREEVKQAILSSIAIFRCNPRIIYPELLLEMLRLPDVRKNVGDNYVSGSALPRIVLKDFKKFKFIVAPIHIQNKIIDLFKSLSSKIHKNESESHRLSLLRDTLLPKLMSGEITL